MLISKAQLEQQDGDFASAERDFSRALRQDPNSTEAQYGLALVYYREGNYRASSAYFRKVAAVHSDLFPVQLLLGMDYLKLDRRREAIPFLQSAQRLKPGDEYANHNLANAEYLAGDYRDACADFIAYLQKEAGKQDIICWYGIGESSLVLAHEVFLRLRPSGSPYALLLLAMTYQQENNWVKAEQYLHQLQRHPDWKGTADAALADVRLHRQSRPSTIPDGDRSAALSTAKELLEARLAIDASDPLKALSLLLPLLPDNSPQVLFWAACILARASEDALSKVIEIAPESAYAHLLRAQTESAGQRTEAALDEYRKAIEIEPKDPIAHFRLGDLLWRSGQYEEAVSAIRAGLALDPNNAAAHYELGNTLIVLLQKDAARKALLEAIQLDPSLANAYKDLGKLYRDAGQLADSTAMLKKAVASDTDGSVNYLLYKHDRLR
jgi:tetratricopeptide (TPR) repeat protein